LALTEEKGSISSHTLAELYSSLYSIKGEMVYEVLHIREAQKMKTRTPLTLNLKYFLSIWPDGKKVIQSPD